MNKTDQSKETILNKPNGPVLAAILSSAIGCFIFSIITLLSETFQELSNIVNWWNPAGTLVGKAGFGIITWIVVWDALNLAWKKRELNSKYILILTYLLLGLSFLLSFPPFFDLFSK